MPSVYLIVLHLIFAFGSGNSPLGYQPSHPQPEKLPSVPFPVNKIPVPPPPPARPPIKK
jgi:hypothetical protein